jgi:hypothetical protein
MTSRALYEKTAAMLAGEMAMARTQTHEDRRAIVIRQVDYIMLSMADIFAADNKHFNRARFYRACGSDR